MKTALMRRNGGKGQHVDSLKGKTLKVENGWGLLGRHAVHVILIILASLVCRKLYLGHLTTSFISTHWSSLSTEALTASPSFQSLISSLRQTNANPGIFFLNKFALPMTHNFLCNTQQFAGAHDRMIFVTLDKGAEGEMRRRWPGVRTFYWPNNVFTVRFGFGDPSYNALYTLRGNVASVLLANGISHWQMQQDTFWRRNLFEFDLDTQGEYDIMFDKFAADDHSPRSQWINGANFHIRANTNTSKFFGSVGTALRSYYAPDMGVMILQCLATMKDDVKCVYAPRSLINSWEWLTASVPKTTSPPWAIQMDAEADTGESKIEMLRRQGMYFVDEGNTCNATKVTAAIARVSREDIQLSASWGQTHFYVYFRLMDYLIRLPVIGNFMKIYFPVSAMYLMLTL